MLLFAVLMSIPWLVPHAGAVALIGFLPLLFAEVIATNAKTRHFWIMHYTAFVLWNAFTTFWVCNATVGGGIFAVLANALQMSVVFGLFRLARKRMGGVSAGEPAAARAPGAASIPKFRHEFAGP